MSRQFWIASGHHLLDHDAAGYLVATADYWRVYLARPEIVPPADACLIERALYDRLRRDPFAAVPSDELAHIGDRDARENWRYFLAFRDHVRAHPTLETAYLAFARGKAPQLPPLFINQLVHVIARNMLDGEQDPYVWRAAEMLFRAQRLTMRDGVMLLADEEQIDHAVPMVDHASPLTTLFEDARAEQLEVLGAATAASYAARSDAHDLVMDFRLGYPARAAFAKVIERWVQHLLGVRVRVNPIAGLDAQWQWYVGLDADGTRIGNTLWSAGTSDPAADQRIVALFQLDFVDPSDVDDKVVGAPVYLILGMNAGQTIRVKPQNLVVGLPLRAWARS
jgi:Family of unknown function (DUF6352)